MNLNEYIKEIQKQYATGAAREHTYRPALQNLLATMLPQLTVANEPARRDCGAPDYILFSGAIPIAFVEAKDIDDADLSGKKKNKEQFDRYKKSLDTILFTDYLDFHLYRYGEYVDSVRIADIRGDKVVAVQANAQRFEQLILTFGNATPQRITSSASLAEHMAAKARLLADVIEKSLSSDQTDNRDNRTLHGQLDAFREVLIHDITPRTFADVYAQTIAYGMFAARLHDKSPDTFSRMEAATLIPKTNPFLRKIFQDIAGFDLDERISWIVDDLAETFKATDMPEVMKNFGRRTRQNDPMIHFYEDFLKAYDPALRKSRGVWYTPQPVVSFIVRAVDEILQTQFGLPMGLADTSKVSLERSIDQSLDKRYADNRKKEMREYHKVQILDPATGTGTFLAEVVEQIYDRFRTQGGMWQSYVEQHLLPRLNGFELLMASYTMAHIKLDMVLEQTGYKHTAKDERLRVYLTNSLEEVHTDTGTLFAQWLANEANEANYLKRDTPVMVVLGNPPYSGESNNKGEWIMKLMDDYKKEPGGKTKLKERNPKWINDDYCKFIRLGQYFVDKNTEGVLAYINSHSFMDNPTFRGMRWHLLNSFDRIYIIDLHGNSKKKETAPDGSKDENVFDIQQGVSINIFVKTGNKPKGQLAEVYHYDLYGKREQKYSTLSENSMQTIPFIKLTPTAPEYLFIPKDNTLDAEYKKGFSVTELFAVSSVGVVTARDGFSIKNSKDEVKNTITEFLKLSDEEARLRYSLGTDSRDWTVAGARKDLQISPENIVPIFYRPFDIRFTNYTGKTKGFHCMPRGNVMQHFLFGENVGLCICKQFKASQNYYHSFITNSIIESSYVSNKTSEITSLFPLYLYPTENKDLFEPEQTTRTPNLDPAIVKKIAKKVGLRFVPEVSDEAGTFAPIHLLDYIYAILHSPAYRERYKEFLKSDFPRIPYPTQADEFWRLVALGSELRQYHLLTHSGIHHPITTYPLAGTNTVDAISYQPAEGADADTGKVWINDTQYFDHVPRRAWEFYIGGYQPAQKWLKDRKTRTLAYDDIVHYQQIIVALSHTDRLMQEIDQL